MHFTLFPDYTPCLISQGAYHNIWRKTLEQGGESVITNSTHVQCQIWNPFKTTSHAAGGESVITNSTHVQCQIWNPFKTTSHAAGGESVITNSTHVQCQIWDLFKTTSHAAGGKQVLLPLPPLAPAPPHLVYIFYNLQSNHP